MPIQRRPHADWRSANRLKPRERMSILLRRHKAGLVRTRSTSLVAYCYAEILWSHLPAQSCLANFCWPKKGRTGLVWSHIQTVISSAFGFSGP